MNLLVSKAGKRYDARIFESPQSTTPSSSRLSYGVLMMGNKLRRELPSKQGSTNSGLSLDRIDPDEGARKAVEGTREAVEGVRDAAVARDAAECADAVRECAGGVRECANAVCECADSECESRLSLLSRAPLGGTPSHTTKWCWESLYALGLSRGSTTRHALKKSFASSLACSGGSGAACVRTWSSQATRLRPLSTDVLICPRSISSTQIPTLQMSEHLPVSPRSASGAMY
mmetsp:Transcript_55962/g.137169  ORF Transcript_55962/g.137169 Transcript_55962/m.137169 type:complete len:231 (+) Transcript_55962:2752-3444(+)